jgi:aldehyde dehydrogenase (NAD+)
MRDCLKFYINGNWVESAGSHTHEVINPATEEVAGRISLGEKEDVDRAVAAARTAFGSYSRTSREERIALLERIFACFQARIPDLSAAITAEMGCPVWLAEKAQIPMPLLQINTEIEVLRNFRF